MLEMMRSVSRSRDKGSYCLIMLFKSIPGLASPKENFDAAWSTIVKEAVTVSSAPQMFPADKRGEWLLAGGFAPFEKNGEKGVAVLYTATGFGKMVNALVLTNTQPTKRDNGISWNRSASKSLPARVSHLLGRTDGSKHPASADGTEEQF
jgi:hypothetical protein